MASSGNFCTINPIGAQGGGTTSPSTLSSGNTAATMQTDTVFGNFGVTSGKWYWEWTLTDSSTSGMAVGWANQQVNSLAELGYNSPSSATGAQIVYMYLSKNPPEIISDAPKSASTGTDSDMSAAIAQNDIIGLAADFDNDKWYFSINGSFTDMRSGQNPSDGSNPMCSASSGGGLVTITRTAGYTWFPAMGNWAAATRDIKVNFGQDSTFGGAITAGGNADENGFGDFKYSVPAGFKAMCSGNLPISDNIDPAQTDDNFPQKNFNTVLFTGNGSSNAVTGLGFQPDLIWGFTRSGAQSKRVIDSTRGGSARFYSDLTSAENTTSTISSFDSDGFTAAGSTFNNDSGKTCGAWCWRANGGTTTSDSSADITVTRQSNTAGGFSILTYSGNGSDNQTIAHGLGAKPAFIIIKNRDTTNHWAAWTQHLGDNSKWIELNATGAAQSDTNQFYNSGMTTSNIGVRSGAAVNGSGNNLVAYVWSEVVGYSKFSTYEGNGNVDGPFVYTGFRPRMVWLKNSEQSANWQVYDTARNVDNVIDNYLAFDNGSVENFASGTFDISIYSNGFKIRSTETNCNTSGRTFIYGAWGDVPFKYNNTF